MIHTEGWDGSWEFQVGVGAEVVLGDGARRHHLKEIYSDVERLSDKHCLKNLN